MYQMVKLALLTAVIMSSLVILSGLIPLVTSIEGLQLILYSLLFGIHVIVAAKICGVN